ncbi:Transposon TX1 uncharacterized protein [Chionoecetes opilio]|uniref:Transposon TX1 uncharacterized protein n=1 Tax=Chionoecetes opilio TaxID=41210 RepID=A0A8J5CM71_CHIOP|nr:Transposon TX1 uncharacterized protein [Chionoecetes opilio]
MAVSDGNIIHTPLLLSIVKRLISQICRFTWDTSLGDALRAPTMGHNRSDSSPHPWKRQTSRILDVALTRIRLGPHKLTQQLEGDDRREAENGDGIFAGLSIVDKWNSESKSVLKFVFNAAKECIGECPRSRRGFVSTETLEKIEESRAARLAGNRDQHRALSRRTRTLLRRDKERCVRSLAEDVEGHLNANDLRPAYRALKKLRSKSPSRASAIRTADGHLVSDMDGQMARWAEYFGQLFTVDPPTEQLHTTGLQAVDADPPIDETAPSLDEVREAVAKLKGGKAAGVCNISAELLKAGGEAMIRGLHAVLTAVWQSGTIPPDWKRGLVVPIWKGKGDRQDCNNYRGITLLSVPGKVLAHLLLTRIRSHLVKHQRPQQSGFTPGKSTTDRILALRVLVERRRVRQGCVLAPSLFNACMDWVLDKVVDQSDCGASVGNTKITDLVFADDEVIFAESLKVLVMALEALHEEAKPLGLEVSWLKTKVQSYEGYLDTWNVCSLFLGLGNLLVWFGCLRYLGFFTTYNCRHRTLSVERLSS